MDTKTLLRNMSTAKLHFKISGFASGTPLRMNIYAVNSKGRSDSVTVETFTLETALEQTGTYRVAYTYPRHIHIFVIPDRVMHVYLATNNNKVISLLIRRRRFERETSTTPRRSDWAGSYLFGFRYGRFVRST